MTDWTYHTETGERGVVHVRVMADGRAVSRLQFVAALAESSTCRGALTRCLRELPAEQIYWENPPLSNASANQPAEFVAVPTGLSRQADPNAFRQFFEPGRLVATFDNLRRDAVLVAPVDHDPDTDYNYLLSFLRTGPDQQLDALWAAVGQAALDHLGDEPRWLSTSGGGVPWLHVRLDSTPKYYSHGPYRRVD